MAKYILNMKEYHKTTEYFFRKEINCMIKFIYFFLSLIVVTLIWAHYFKIDILVKARGVIRPTQTISSTVSLYDGKVAKVNYYNGKKVEKNEVLYSMDTFSYKINLRKNLDIINRKEKELSNLRDLLKSISNHQMKFNNTENKYYYQYLKHDFEIKRLKSILREAEMAYLKNKELGYDYISEMELEKFRRDYEEALYNFQMADVRLLSEVKEKISLLEEEVVYLEREAEDLRKKIAFGNFKSPISGIIQCKKVLNIGDYVPSDMFLFNIIPQSSKLRMEITVLNKDISKVKLNQKVKYRIDSLSYKEFGVSRGEVTGISADISPKGTYLVEASIEKLKLKNKTENIEALKIGMESDVRIITKRKSVLRIILEKLDFMNE